MPPGAAIRAASQQRGERYSLGSRRRGRPSDFPSDARVPDEPRNPCGGRRIWHAIWHGSRKTRCDGGTQRDEPKWRPMLFRRLLLYSAGTGETHWDGGTLLRIRRLGVRISLRARKSAGHRLADERLIFGFSKFGTQVVPDVGILTRPEARFPLQRSLPLRPPVAYARAGLGVAVAANWASLRMRDATTEEGCRPSRYDQNLAHDGSATSVEVKALGRFGDRTATPLSYFG